MRLLFHKMQGCGNDFLILDYLHNEPPQFYPREVQYLCDRHFGIGADGLVILQRSDECHAAWKFYNSDGSEAEMCGNAARCVIKFLAERHFPEETPITLQTRAGIIKGRKLDDSPLIEITLLPDRDVKFDYEQKIVATDSNSFDTYFINTGVPHAVIEIKDIHSYPLIEVGRALRHHPAFGPEGANITFFQRLVGQRIRSTTFERGVEYETLACGTGVAAAAIIFSELYLQSFPIEVNVPGGDLMVDVSPVSKMLLLRGPAEYVMDVELNEVPHTFEKPHLYSERKRRRE